MRQGHAIHKNASARGQPRRSHLHQRTAGVRPNVWRQPSSRLVRTCPRGQFGGHLFDPYPIRPRERLQLPCRLRDFSPEMYLHAALNVMTASSASPVRSTLTATQCRSSMTTLLATAASRTAFNRLSGSPFMERGSTTPIAHRPSIRPPPAPSLISQEASRHQRRATFVLILRPRTVE